VGREGVKYIHYETETVEQQMRNEPAALAAEALPFYAGTALAFLGAFLP